MNTLIDKIVTPLKEVEGIVGIVLGGSRATNTHSKDSDYDIGIYYDEDKGFNIHDIDPIATQLDDESRSDLVSDIGGWGPWVNAGAWMTVDGQAVDIIFRDIHRVAHEIQNGLNGKISSHYHAGHPHAFLNIMYMGELAVSQILFDEMNQLKKLKEKTQPYPKALKETIINHFIFEADFAYEHAKGSIHREDIYYVSGNYFRSVSSLNQILFALNEVYCLNEKKAVQRIESLAQKPSDYKKRVDCIFTKVSVDKNRLEQSLIELRALIDETTALVESMREE